MTRLLSRRDFLKTVTVAAGVILTGCGQSNDLPGFRVTLTQWYHQYGEKGTQDAVMRYAQEYTRLHPDVAVRVVWVPGDYHTKLATALLTRGGPDVFESQLTVPMVTAEQVVPLDDLYAPDVRADFPAQDLAVNTVGGKIYGVKMLDDTGILYYRKSLLQKAGVALPATMDTLIAAAKALTTGSRKGLFVGNDGGISALLNIAPWSAGSDFLVNDKIVFNTPRTVAAYEKLRELSASSSVLMGAPTDYWDPSALTQDLAAMQWTGLWAFPPSTRPWATTWAAWHGPPSMPPARPRRSWADGRRWSTRRAPTLTRRKSTSSGSGLTASRIRPTGAFPTGSTSRPASASPKARPPCASPPPPPPCRPCQTTGGSCRRPGVRRWARP